LLGYGADRWFGTEPKLFLAGLVLGFVAFVLSVIRLPKRLEGLDDGPDGEPPEES